MNTNDIGIEANLLKSISSKSKRIQKNLDKVSDIVKRDIKTDRNTFITPEYLKRALDAVCAFTPEDSDRGVIHKAIDVVFTENFIVKYINKAYRYIFNKPDGYLKENTDLKSHAKYISKEIGKEVDNLVEETKKKCKLVAANEQIKIINYLRSDILPAFEKLYKKILFFKEKEDVETTPELVSATVKKLEKVKRKNVKMLKNAKVQDKISKGSVGDYADAKDWLSSAANDFKMLTHYDKIFTIWDKIIDEIDKWR